MPEPEKKLIEVTVEKRLRVCKEIEATEEEIEFLRRRRKYKLKLTPNKIINTVITPSI